MSWILSCSGSGGDFLTPIVGVAEKEDGSGQDIDPTLRLTSSRQCSKSVPIAAGEDDWEIEVELRLTLDEFIEAVGHFGFDIGILMLFFDVEVCAVAEVDDIGAGEDADAFGDAVAHFHQARAAAGD